MDLLNGQFASGLEYFEQVVPFLIQYQWAYQSANTHLLLDNVTQRLPAKWVESLKFSQWQRLQKAAKETDQVEGHYFRLQIIEYTYLYIHLHFICSIVRIVMHSGRRLESFLTPVLAIFIGHANGRGIYQRRPIAEKVESSKS